MGIKLFHVLHGDRGPIHVLHIYVGDMKTPAQQRDVCLRFVAEKLGAPDPGRAGGRRLGSHDQRRTPVHRKVEPLIARPLGYFHRGAVPGAGECSAVISQQRRRLFARLLQRQSGRDSGAQVTCLAQPGILEQVLSLLQDRQRVVFCEISRA